MGETGILREKWLRQVFEKAAAESYASDSDEKSKNVGLDQDTAITLLKEINADLATARIRQKLAVDTPNHVRDSNSYRVVVSSRSSIQWSPQQTEAG